MSPRPQDRRRRPSSGRQPEPRENRFTAQRDRGLGGEQVEGRRAVRELLAADRRRVREVYIAQGMDESDLVAEIIEMCIERRVPIRQVGRSRVDHIAKSDAPQGVVAMAAPLPEVDLSELTASSEHHKPFLLAFDGVTDPHNLGSLIRTGECAGITGVVLPKHRAVHVTPTVAKASAGAVEHVPMSVVTGLPSALTDMKEAGVWTVGLDPDGDIDVNELAVADQPLVLVFGAEGAGLSRLTKQRCDVLARIPQYGSVASLNVAAAGAVACFAIAHRRATDES
jgi:23S rRNA (guanosine2251-2'-O)-methyltransferase